MKMHLNLVTPTHADAAGVAAEESAGRRALVDPALNDVILDDLKRKIDVGHVGSKHVLLDKPRVKSLANVSVNHL